MLTENDTNSLSSNEMMEDFVQVEDPSSSNEAEEALSIKVKPRHETIGIDVPLTLTDFCTTVKARSLPEEDDSVRAPVDIVVALDVSGSMNGQKLELCKQTLSLLLRELSSEDRFGLVTFGSEANLAIPTRKLNDSNRQAAVAKIASIHTSGMTNMSGGIGAATNEMRCVESPHEVRTIFLLTDGHANVGVSDQKGIVELTKNCLESLSGENGGGPISIHCFGYGSDHDNEMLRDVSSATQGGTYYFVEQDSNVLSAFGDALGGVLSVVAQNVVVDLQAPASSGVTIIDVKDDRAVKRPDGSYRVNLGDFYAEESRDIILQATLSSQNGVSVPHVTATLSYLDTINKRLVADRSATANISRPSGSELSAVDTHLALQCVRIEATEAIAKAEKLAEDNRLEEAKSTIKTFSDNMQKKSAQLGVSKDPLVLQLSAESENMRNALSSRTEYVGKGSKYVQTRLQAHKMQRCSEAQVRAANAPRNVYAIKKKSKMMSNFASASGGGTAANNTADAENRQRQFFSPMYSQKSPFAGGEIVAAAAAAAQRRNSATDSLFKSPFAGGGIAAAAAAAAQRRNSAKDSLSKSPFAGGGIAAAAAAAAAAKRKGTV